MRFGDKDKEREIRPFLKWAGGKRWLAPQVVEIIGSVRGRYVEPFLGGGSVYFSLLPERALLSDKNSELINVYQVLQSDPAQLAKLLQEHQKNHSDEYYYSMRDYAPTNPHRQAARFVYLNRTCWNGLYRVNLKGEFNVPIGTKTSVVLPDDDWRAVSRMLKRAEIVCSDFEVAIDTAGKGDVVFADPPYTVKHNLNGFIKYNDSLFSWADQLRLFDTLLRAKKRGARVVITNANHESVRKLYASGGFRMNVVERASVLAASSVHRGRYEELLIS
ncbi:DNA adenine methylase [Ramlibacter albus]|uniref:Site-specific DNA-methyltransferase (adenine-specific) n=1 Tax=Ramlibacter albus TaxID=2079448 RepID=A0A923S490_9BURK|nr:Dam family site-specific DNA-(adenine-N6)-methyltransferase [Ramlibacter albus]MBC5767226.1 Dam family site-specific DNA-(adenine-N6)-methyltransferase [Ramlibacter albus]